jgi:hypothetical protein
MQIEESEQQASNAETSIEESWELGSKVAFDRAWQLAKQDAPNVST